MKNAFNAILPKKINVFVPLLRKTLIQFIRSTKKVRKNNVFAYFSIEVGIKVSIYNDKVNVA